MFRDERIYRAIMFSSPSVRDLNAARGLLPKKAISKAAPPIKCPHGSIEHWFYYSPNAFTRNIDLLKEVTEKRNGVTQYRYNLYLIGMTQGKTFSIMLAVPFLKMAKELYSHVRSETRGKDFEFNRILMNRAFELSKKGEDSAALLKITRVKYNIEGDGFAESVGFVGSHLAQCATLGSLMKGLEGPKLTPERVRLSMDDRLSFDTDQLGHYWFNVSKNADNLQFLPDVFRMLAQLKLVEANSAFPHMRHFDATDSEVNQSNE